MIGYYFGASASLRFIRCDIFIVIFIKELHCTDACGVAVFLGIESSKGIDLAFGVISSEDSSDTFPTFFGVHNYFNFTALCGGSLSYSLEFVIFLVIEEADKFDVEGEIHGVGDDSADCLIFGRENQLIEIITVSQVFTAIS